MKRVGFGMLIVGMALAVSSLAWGAEAPRFHFKAGETLSYEVSMGTANATDGGNSGMTLQGTLELKVLKVLPSGNAENQADVPRRGGRARAARRRLDRHRGQGSGAGPPHREARRHHPLGQGRLGQARQRIFPPGLWKRA